MKPFAIVFAILSAFVLSANAADTFKVDPVHTFVLFSVQHLGIANTYGRFNDISGPSFSTKTTLRRIRSNCRSRWKASTRTIPFASGA